MKKQERRDVVNPALLDGFRLAQFEQDLGVYGIHVYQEGEGVCEHRFRADDRSHLFSASKTFVSMAIGMAEAEGLLHMTDRALDFFPQCAAGAAPGAEKIAVLDLLRMQGGHASLLFSSNPDSHLLGKDWVQVYFETPMAHPAGTAYFYDNGCSYVLARIVEAVSGQRLCDYLMPRLFEPLGIPNPQWDTCPRGHAMGGVGLHLKTRELACLGQLLLQKGRWEGGQLVPREYIERASSDIVMAEGFGDAENCQGYGYQLWRCTVPGAFRADGKYGQYTIVLPDRRSVVTVTAHNERQANDILRAVWREVLPRL